MKIAFILFSNGLEYDDRIRKEMFSIRELLGEVEFKIFAFHGDNHSETGVLSYGVPFEFVSIRSRGGKKSLLSMLRKEYDFYSQIKPKLKGFDLLWVCDDQPFFFPLFSRKPIIWDLHEIPTSIIGTRIKNYIFHRMESRCRYLIHANQERLEYLIANKIVKSPKKNLILRNVPDQDWLAQRDSFSSSFLQFKKWLQEDEYIYLQGLNGGSRYPMETLSSIMEAKCIKAVVVGNVPDEIIRAVSYKYPDLAQYIYFTGQVVQSETAAFLGNCKFSIVFYKTDTPNNTYCEPNRMFQSLGIGKPVLAGSNSPMRNIIEKYGNGIVLYGDGGNVEENVRGIHCMLDSYDNILKLTQESMNCFKWEAQLPVFRRIFNK